MNPSSIRRFIFTLITGYLAIFGVQKLPYEFENQWLVLIPVLIVVYIITVWMDGLFFKDVAVDATAEPGAKKVKKQAANKGFGR
ncbi:hypothetical protein [Synechococcus sp. MIT S9509]|uniref:hypothetical protein n=1 Tax=unclassified Synechococcus TaxID=2626047 RepID=UPI0039AF8946